MAVRNSTTAITRHARRILDFADVDSEHGVSTLFAYFHTALYPAALASVSTHEYHGDRCPR